MSNADSVTDAHILQDKDVLDSTRIVQVAVTIVALPSVVSAQARALARTRLRQLAYDHPGSAELLAAIVQHLESY